VHTHSCKEMEGSGGRGGEGTGCIGVLISIWNPCNESITLACNNADSSLSQIESSSNAITSNY
jgi:hypothetical protein